MAVCWSSPDTKRTSTAEQVACHSCIHPWVVSALTWTVMAFLSTGSKERRSQMSAMRSAASLSTLLRKSETTARPGCSLCASPGLPKACGSVWKAAVASAQVRGRRPQCRQGRSLREAMSHAVALVSCALQTQCAGACERYLCVSEAS